MSLFQRVTDDDKVRFSTMTKSIQTHPTLHVSRKNMGCVHSYRVIDSPFIFIYDNIIYSRKNKNVVRFCHWLSLLSSQATFCGPAFRRVIHTHKRFCHIMSWRGDGGWGNSRKSWVCFAPWDYCKNRRISSEQKQLYSLEDCFS